MYASPSRPPPGGARGFRVAPYPNMTPLTPLSQDKLGPDEEAAWKAYHDFVESQMANRPFMEPLTPIAAAVADQYIARAREAKAQPPRFEGMPTPGESTPKHASWLGEDLFDDDSFASMEALPDLGVARTPEKVREQMAWDALRHQFRRAVGRSPAKRGAPAKFAENDPDIKWLGKVVQSPPDEKAAKELLDELLHRKPAGRGEPPKTPLPAASASNFQTPSRFSGPRVARAQQDADDSPPGPTVVSMDARVIDNTATFLLDLERELAAEKGPAKQALRGASLSTFDNDWERLDQAYFARITVAAGALALRMQSVLTGKVHATLLGPLQLRIALWHGYLATMRTVMRRKTQKQPGMSEYSNDLAPFTMTFEVLRTMGQVTTMMEKFQSDIRKLSQTGAPETLESGIVAVFSRICGPEMRLEMHDLATWNVEPARRPKFEIFQD